MNRRLAEGSAVDHVIPAVVVASAGAIVSVADAEQNLTDDKPVNGGDNEDLEKLQGLYDLMKEEGLESLELEDENTKIRLQRARRGSSSSHETHGHPRPSAHTPSQSAPEPESNSESSSSGQTLVTPLAGVFYRSSSPTNPPYVQEGTVAEVGQTLCIVEAMKVMNEIKAESRCRIVKIMAENSRPVTAGQVLFQVEPA